MKHRAGIGVLFKLLVILIIAVIIPAVGFGEVPQQINYQGNLTDASGIPLSGNYTMEFFIYDVSTNGTELWSESQTVPVASGIYNVQIGQNPGSNPFPDDLFDDPHWLGVNVGADTEMIPRQPLTSVSFALMSDGISSGAVTATMLANNVGTGDKIANNTITGDKIIDGSVTVSDIQDGSGSGLDADKVDGFDASEFVMSNTAAL